MKMLSHPTGPLIAGQYGLPEDQAFAPSPPQQYAHPVPIPPTNNGITKQIGFHKLNYALSGGKPIAKIVIATQMLRF